MAFKNKKNAKSYSVKLRSFVFTKNIYQYKQTIYKYYNFFATIRVGANIDFLLMSIARLEIALPVFAVF